MKMQIIVQALILKKAQKEFTDRDGKKIPYYQIVLDQNDNVDTFTCSLDVYDSVSVGSPANLIGTIDTSTDRPRIKFIGLYSNEKSK